MAQDKWQVDFVKRSGKLGSRTVTAEDKDIAEAKIINSVKDIRYINSVKRLSVGESKSKKPKVANIMIKYNDSLYQATGTTYNNGVGVSKEECEDNRSWHKTRGHKTKLVNLGNDKFILYVEDSRLN